MEARIYTRTGSGHSVMRVAFETELPPLAHAEAPAQFVF
jgi:hypothetical protein